MRFAVLLRALCLGRLACCRRWLPRCQANCPHFDPLCPLTSTLREAPLVRIAVAPSPRNGLRQPSQLMVDKLFTLPIQALGDVVGWLDLP